VLAFLARFLPARATLSLDAWQGDDTAAQITLHTTWKVMSQISDVLKNFPFEIKGL
jgi:hypothetical protein